MILGKVKGKRLYVYDRQEQLVIIDGRGKSHNEVRSIASKVFNHKPFEEDVGKNGDHGFFFAGNLIHYYNIKSVCDGIVVASLNEMTPEQTRPLAKSFLEDK